MRISELARQSGLPVATIKFYLREGLLPAGTPISRTQAEYSDAHLERLRLIRALRDIADLPVATVGTVLAAVDDEEIPLLDLLGVTQTAVAGFKGSTPPTEAGAVLAAKLLADLNWTLTDDSPLVDSLARVLDVLHGEGEPVDAESLRPWADAARAVAEVEMDHIPVTAPRAEAAHTVAVGTVIYGELLAQLRLAAQEAVSLERYGPQTPPAGAETETGTEAGTEPTGSTEPQGRTEPKGRTEQKISTEPTGRVEPKSSTEKGRPESKAGRTEPEVGRVEPELSQSGPKASRIGSKPKPARVSRRAVERPRSRG